MDDDKSQNTPEGDAKLEAEAGEKTPSIDWSTIEIPDETLFERLGKVAPDSVPDTLIKGTPLYKDLLAESIGRRQDKKALTEENARLKSQLGNSDEEGESNEGDSNVSHAYEQRLAAMEGLLEKTINSLNSKQEEQEITSLQETYKLRPEDAESLQHVAAEHREAMAKRLAAPGFGGDGSNPDNQGKTPQDAFRERLQRKIRGEDTDDHPFSIRTQTKIEGGAVINN